jgi:hypothetical protein
MSKIMDTDVIKIKCRQVITCYYNYWIKMIKTLLLSPPREGKAKSAVRLMFADSKPTQLKTVKIS